MYGLNGFGPALRGESHDTHEYSQQEKGYFLQQKAPTPSESHGWGLAMAPKAVQRPVIEEEEYEGKGDEHWFGEEPHRKQNERSQVRHESRPADVGA